MGRSQAGIESRISASVWKKDCFAIIQIKNYYEGALTLRDGLPLSSKGDT